MFDRRDYVNGSGVWVPTETEAIMHVMGVKRMDEIPESIIYARRSPSVLREHDLIKLDEKRAFFEAHINGDVTQPVRVATS